MNLYGDDTLADPDALDPSVLIDVTDHLQRGINGYLACHDQ